MFAGVGLNEALAFTPAEWTAVGLSLRVASVGALASLPFGVLSYREHKRRDTQAAAAAQAGNVVAPEQPPSAVPFAAGPDVAKADEGERPTRH